MRRWIVYILFSVAMIAFAGRVLGIDGRGVLASSATFVQEGRWDINFVSGMAWDAPPPGGQNVWSPALDVYTKKAPMTILAHVPFAALGRLLPFYEIEQTALLLMPLVYALTGALWLTVAQGFGLSRRWAFIGALWWGLGTYALGNTLEIFAEPIIAFGLLLAVYGIQHHTQSPVRGALYAGIGGALAVGGNLASVLLLVPLAFGLWLAPRQWRDRFLAWVWFAVPVALMLAVILYFNYLRTGNPLSSGYFFAEGEGFTTPFALGFFGLVFSAYRGLIWYAPVAVLLPLGVWWRRRAPLTWLMVSLIVIQVVTYSLWWAWHGGGGWGPRFLLPVLPLIVLLGAAAAERLYASRIGRVLVIALGVFSAYIQLPAILSHYIHYEFLLYSRYGVTPDNFATIPLVESPIFGHRETMAMANGWPAWMYGENPLVGALLIGLALAVVVLAWRWWRHPRAVLLHIGLALTVLSGVIAVTYSTALFRPAYQGAVEDYVASHASPQDRLLLNSNSSYWDLLYIENRPPTYSIPPYVTDTDAQARQVLDKLFSPRQGRTPSGWVWYMAQAGERTWMEDHLWRTAFAGDYGEVEGMRLIGFATTEASLARQRLMVNFESARLRRVGVGRDGENLFVNLNWNGTAPSEATAFVHLLKDGEIVAQHDRVPYGLTRPRPSGAVNDRHVFRLPPGADPSGYALRIGWARADGDADGGLIPVTETGEMFVLLPLDDILPPE